MTDRADEILESLDALRADMAKAETGAQFAEIARREADLLDELARFPANPFDGAPLLDPATNLG